MSLFEVNPDKCNRDGICVAECPIKIIALKDKESVPVPVPGADELCINCGHCVAVCPTAALSHKNMTPEQCPDVKKEWVKDAERAEHFLRSRRSVGHTKKKPLIGDMLSKLIEIASYAPSGHNTQRFDGMLFIIRTSFISRPAWVVDWMRYMIKEQPEMAAAMHMELVVGAWDFGVDVVCRDAPHLVITHGLQSDRTAPTACTIGMTYLELAAPSLDWGPAGVAFLGLPPCSGRHCKKP